MRWRPRRPRSRRTASSSLTATVGQRSLELSVGPFASGGASRLRSAAEIPQAGDVIGRLADEVEVADAEDGEYLVLHVRG